MLHRFEFATFADACYVTQVPLHLMAIALYRTSARQDVSVEAARVIAG
jgi:hypothetical protein